MAYKIRLYSEYILGNTGSALGEVEDSGVYYNQTSIPMVGVGTVGYAASIAEALLWQLENFAGGFPPTNPVTGQLWYDTNSSSLKVYNGGDWVSPIQGGSVAQDGESFTWLGNWSPSITYLKNDVIHYSGSSYICIANSVLSAVSPDNDNTSWDLMCSAGSVGATGATGAVGASGTPGSTGPAGTSFRWRGAWATTTSYLVNDVVSNGGSTYICITANSDATFTPSKWNLMASAGTSGTVFTYENTYNNATSYNINDIVVYQGSSYISKSDNNTNRTPSSEASYWGLLASKGDTGAASFTMYVQSSTPSGTIPNGSLWVKI